MPECSSCCGKIMNERKKDRRGNSVRDSTGISRNSWGFLRNMEGVQAVTVGREYTAANGMDVAEITLTERIRNICRHIFRRRTVETMNSVFCIFQLFLLSHLRLRGRMFSLTVRLRKICLQIFLISCRSDFRFISIPFKLCTLFHSYRLSPSIFY